MKTVGTFSNEVFFKPFDPKSQPDLASLSWLYFSGYPFGLGLKYPFPRVISKFFEITQISYIQAMPIVWRVLFWIEKLNQSRGLDIVLVKLAHVYDVATFGNSRFPLCLNPH